MAQDTINRIAFLERRESELAIEEASLPTTPRFRRALRDVRRQLSATREELAHERSMLEFEQEMEAKLADLTPEERAYHDEMWAKYQEYEASKKAEVVAKRRRAQFRVVDGGKS